MYCDEQHQKFLKEREEAVRAEVRAVRALWYSILCDTHGNVPILTSFTPDVPKQSTRKEVYDFVIKELKESLPLLSDKVDQSTYGRLTRWGAHCVLARMYLNAEVYTGTPAWNEALAECLLRLGQDEQEAANLATQVRMRAFDDPAKAVVTVADLKADTKIKYGILNEQGAVSDPGDVIPVQFGGLYDEWGWEFVAEARRRTDMIRFGTYQTKSWFNHKPVGNYTTLFPIHFEDMNTNSNLKQNPGYGN